MKMNEVGNYAFFLGVLVVVVDALAKGIVPQVGLLLLVLGVIVGLLNIKEKESTAYLVAAIALVVSGNITWPVGVEIVGVLIGGISQLVGPAAVIVALKEVWMIAKG